MLGASLARSYRAVAVRPGGDLVRIGGVAVPDRMGNGDEDRYYADQLLCNLGIAESWGADGERSISVSLAPGARAALARWLRDGVWPDWPKL